jgi:hypothetical protein
VTVFEIILTPPSNTKTGRYSGKAKKKHVTPNNKLDNPREKAKDPKKKESD